MVLLRFQGIREQHPNPLLGQNSAAGDACPLRSPDLLKFCSIPYDMTASRHEYTAEFKEEAVRLVVSSQKNCAEIARNLGIASYLVHWKHRHEQKGAAGRPQFTGRRSQRSVSKKRGARSLSENSKSPVRNAGRPGPRAHDRPHVFGEEMDS